MDASKKGQASRITLLTADLTPHRMSKRHEPPKKIHFRCRAARTHRQQSSSHAARVPKVRPRTDLRHAWPFARHSKSPSLVRPRSVQGESPTATSKGVPFYVVLPIC